MAIFIVAEGPFGPDAGPGGGTAMVTFHRLGDGRTRIMLQLEYEPEGAAENVGDALGVVSCRVEGDLQRFEEFIEARGRETGAWRGEIPPKPDTG